MRGAANFSALLLGLCLACAHGAGAEEKSAWPFEVRAEHRPGTYWWCPGSAFTKTDIDWNLEKFSEAGFGFVHLIPIYGAKGAEDRSLSYLSPEWMEMLDYTVRRAQSLGLFVDMTTGTGWCFGGPDLPEDGIDAVARYDAAKNEVALKPAMKVKRAGPGGEGPMLNPFSPRAMTHYLDRFSAAFEKPGAALPRAQYHDSFEYRADWCAGLIDEFKRRRGYDLRDHLREFFGDTAGPDPEPQARVKCDYRQTLAELHLEFIKTWAQWTRERGMVTRNQAHGSPANLLDVYAAADIPETEMFGAPEFPIPGFRRDPDMVRDGDSDPRICMLAASAAHVAHPPGRQLVTSESCTWLREHWHGSLAQIKLELDLFFLAGVNQMLFHGSCYSPRDAAWPGWFFYASTKMDWRNSIWRDVPFLTDYIGRCQSVLQAGQPANDVLLYWPIHDLWMNPEGTTIQLSVHHHDWMAKQPVGEVAGALLEKGFAFDFVSDAMVAGLRFEDGKIIAPGGEYRALVVPACRHMPETTLEFLAELSEHGAPVIFEKGVPGDVPGLADLERRRTRLATARGRLEKAGARVADEITKGLSEAGVPREAMADAGLRFIRRREGDGYWYFIANHTAKDFDGWLRLAMPFAGVTRFDPMTGRSGRLVDENGEARLALAAGETAVLRAGSEEPREDPWPRLEPAGEPVNVTGEWSVAFIDGGPELPAAHTTRELASWTEAADSRAQAFAGTARYAIRFAAPPAADDWLLDLGDVRESARIRLNGKDAGALIALPFRTTVGEWLQPGENLLEIEVTNLTANRIRDLEKSGADWKIMKDANIVNVNYQKFEPAKWDLVPSGLLGPVKLVPMRISHR